MHDVELVILWLNATKDLRSLHEKIDVGDAYAKLFARKGNISQEALMDDLEDVSRAVLQRARIRLDITTMLMDRIWFEYLWQNVNPEDIYFSAH